MRLFPKAIVAFIALASLVSAQQATLPPATQAAIDARRAELARQARAETDAAIAKRNAGAMPDRIRLTVGSPTENRTGAGAGTLSIPVTLFLEDIPPNAMVRAHRIIRAVDNLDQPLVVSTNGPAAGQIVIGGAVRGRAGAPTNTRQLMFQAPPRKAETIKSIDGEIEFLVPGDATNAKVTGLSALAGKTIEHPLLAKNGLDVTYLTREMYDALRPTWGTSAAANGAGNFAISVFFLVKDPHGRLVSIEIQDSAERTIQRSTLMRNTNALGVTLVEAQIGAPVGAVRAGPAAPPGPTGTLIPEDAQLVVVIAAPEALKSLPFHLENIPLP